MPSKSKVTFRCLHSKAFFVSILFVVALFFSCFTSIFSYDLSHFALGAPDRIVQNESELRNAVAITTKPVVIALDNDIVLTSTLSISANKDITLTSTAGKNFFKLIGADSANPYSTFQMPNVAVGTTIDVESGGVLRLGGIIVTHESGSIGRGVYVNGGGSLIMYSGEISGNSANMFLPVVGNYCSTGGGVDNRGDFEMHGGKISNNNAPDGYGGGVNNYGNFVMYGGEITNNTASRNGGGVCNGLSANFVMSGGQISNNKVSSVEFGFGGGVFNGAVFTMFMGKIFNNEAVHGGGVYVTTGNIHADMTCDGSFSMFGGEISGNIAQWGGGVQNTGVFSMSGGVISYNQATYGGGVYITPYDSNSPRVYIFSMSGGVISYNQATYGGGVYNYFNGNFSLSKNGVISDNIAEVGGGVYNDGTFSRRNGEISDNTAEQYSDIYSTDDNTISDDNTFNDDNIVGYVVLVVALVVVSVIVCCFFRNRLK
ncbi:MAG: hypothetical protein FWB84_02405 [Candidatus Bathyarchaeota archaeon]|uniref:hypothetical protein n=1 Tax=Candidatus Bathycorpusculum sp. TaxID=2994959 RepID=UPI00282C23DF|nr:hypothetical protein [Candidatus Termiticorpusculum sp.]MCL2257007.1 hypothetical protein [Candidatus Termiticorpusculum sp.]MCL2292869.1 hypothetical protein [Candidatus Termiticorpusculum sp.]